MITEKFIELKNFNRDLLGEELAALVLAEPISDPHLAGFVKLTARTVEPAPSLVAIVTNKGIVTDSAEPGEIRINVETALAGADLTTLAAAFAVHDSTQLSTEQQRADKDETGLPLLLEDLERAKWDAVPGNQQVVNSAHIETLRRAVQFLFRDHSSANIDTDD